MTCGLGTVLHRIPAQKLLFLTATTGDCVTDQALLADGRWTTT